MLILFNSEGRFAHQLSQFVHLLIIAKKNDSNFFYSSFQRKYLKYFELESESLVSNQSIKLKVYYLIYLILRVLKIKKISSESTAFNLNLKKKDTELLLDQSINEFLDFKKKYFIFDYALKDINSIIQNRSYVLKILKPNKSINDSVQLYIDTIRKQHKVLLGIHIRRTDYAHFQDGRFYLGDGQILSLVESFYEQIGIDPNLIALIICSDETISTDLFNNYSLFYERRDFIEDFFILKSCDYIIGPHSIFTLMANYLGDSKLCQITDKSTNQLNMNNFHDSEQLLKQEYMHIKSVDER